MEKTEIEKRDKFLEKTRYGFLSTLTKDGAPRTVPVWFSWDGTTIRIFTETGSAKMKRIKRDPRASLLVSNDPDEPEYWVAFDGQATINLEGGYELAEKLADRYWDLSDEDQIKTLKSWKSADENLCVLEIVPEKIRTY